jgi:ankyrin repeat protein
MGASFYGHREVVQALLAKGTEVNAKANNGGTALMAASQNGHREIRELLLKAGAKN